MHTDELPRLRAWLETGIVAAAATGGVLARFGMAGAGAAAPFAALGRAALGEAPDGGAVHGAGLPLLGAALHLATTLLWALPFVLVARRWRGGRLLLAALVTAAVAGLTSARLLPAVWRAGYGADASLPQLFVLHLTLALGLAAGMRLAQLDGRVEQ